MTIIAHISDLHFGAEDSRVVKALRQELNADPPDLIAISGDLTQAARRREFRAARAFVESLAAPILAVPGNHDLTPFNLAERFADPYGRWHAAISPDTEPVWRNERVAVFGLNTAHRAGLHWDWSRGRITRRRLDGLLERMNALPGHLVRIVVAHHPLIAPEDLPGLVLVGKARPALAALEQAGVKLVLAGHAHRTYSGPGSAGSSCLLVVQSSTTTSVRLRGEPNAYNRITVGQDGRPLLEVRVWDGAGWVARAPRPARARGRG